MAFFNGTVAALAAGNAALFAPLVHLDFADGAVWMWDGFGDIVIDGDTYKGDGGMAQISEIPVSLNDTASNVTFTLSGVSQRFVELAQEAESVRGRDMIVYGQFFDEAIQPLDSKFVLAMLVMDTLSYRASGPADRAVTLTAETLWIGRNAASFAFFSDRDQQARFAGDRGLEFVTTLKDKKIKWPVY